MKTILIVDDNSTVQRLLSYTLKRQDFDILVANNGKEALSQLALKPVDLAIVDLAMPEMDGLTLLRHLRADAAFHSPLS